MVEWYESDTSDNVRRAPLILIPVALDRSNARGRFYVSYTGEDLGANLSFVEKVRTDFRIEIPDLPDDEDLDVNAYFSVISRRIKDMKRWSVDRESVVLGLFSFSKFLMYKDLDPNNTRNGPQQSDIIKSLFGDGFSEPGPKIGEEDHLDDHIRPEDIHHIVDADASQALAIFDVNQGRNLVIQGPPGTGKSQTITNIIAEAVGGDRTVLFVSEKMAALEVVKRRLDDMGVGVACLELHSRKTTKRTILDELKRTLGLGAPNVERVEDDFGRLARIQNRLNTYAEAVNTPVGRTGVTPYRAYGELIAGRDQESGNRPLSVMEVAGMDSWSETDFESKLEVVSDLQARLGRVGVPRNHVFWGARLRLLLPNDQAFLEEKVASTLESLEVLRKATQDLSYILGLSPPEHMALAEAHLPIAQHAAMAPDIRGVDLCALEQHPQRDEIKHLADAGSSWHKLHSVYDSILKPSAWDADVRETVDTLSTIGRRFRRLVHRKYYRARKHLRNLCRADLPTGIERQTDIARAILEEQEHRRTLERLTPLAIAVFRQRWEGAESDWEFIRQTAEWTTYLFGSVVTSEMAPSVAKSLRDDIDKGRLGITLDQTTRALDSHAENTRALQDILQLDKERSAGLETLSFTEQQELLNTWSSRIDEIQDLVGFNNAAHVADEEGLGTIVELAEEWPEATGHLKTVLERAWYTRIVSRAMEERPALSKFDGNNHERLIGQFRSMDELALDHNRARVVHSHWSQLPKFEAGGQLRILRREFEKKRKHLPIRQLMAQAGNVIQAIKPVFMMSPMSISSYLEPGSVRFDMVVFDEASQVKPVDALGALMRAEQAVVVGDSQQLPPTRFFDAVTMSDDDQDDNVTADIESILGLFRIQGVPDRMLRWHYRSRHESLIAVSNREFYENGLVVFPSPDSSREKLGLRYHYLPDTVYDRARSRTNRKEAAEVGEAVMRHARENPNLTLGVAAFSSAQMEAIQDELEKLRRLDSSCEGFFNDHPEEPFFVKNLENVQGDERDVIFISVGYGRDANGQVAMNFGPLSADGGEKRLNVLITRAKQRCHVFSNIRSTDIDLNRTSSRGTRALKTFLAYAETGVLEELEVETGRETHSPFQEAVADGLRSLGQDVREEVSAGGKFIDLAIVDTEHPGRYVLGIECDGATYHSSRSARDRDRLREEHLRNLGWRLHRIWSTDWFRNPDRELDRAVEAIEQAKSTLPDEYATEGKTRPEIERGDNNLAKVELTTHPYELARPHLRLDQYELHEVSPDYMLRPITEIVRAEGPVHVSEVQRRIANAAGVKRIGERIRENLDLAITYATRRKAVVMKGDFLWKPGVPTPVVRDRTDIPRKKIDLVAPEEIAEAIQVTVKRSYGIGRPEAVTETGRLLGFKSVSKSTRTRIDQVLEKLIGDGDLVSDGSHITTVK